MNKGCKLGFMQSEAARRFGQVRMISWTKWEWTRFCWNWKCHWNISSYKASRFSFWHDAWVYYCYTRACSLSCVLIFRYVIFHFHISWERPIMTSLWSHTNEALVELTAVELLLIHPTATETRIRFSFCFHEYMPPSVVVLLWHIFVSRTRSQESESRTHFRASSMGPAALGKPANVCPYQSTVAYRATVCFAAPNILLLQAAACPVDTPFLMYGWACTMLKSHSNKRVSPACWAFIRICCFDVIACDKLWPVIMVDLVLSKYAS